MFIARYACSFTSIAVLHGSGQALELSWCNFW